jgi:molybdopterin-containing oxidoreductase family iron-sulfur binding subunit
MSRLNEHRPRSAPEAGHSDEGRRYWRGLEALARSPQWQKAAAREFPEGASEMTNPVSRRAFLSLMGASVALAGGLAGCRRPEQPIYPYTKSPEDLLPGVTQHYATSAEIGGQVMGLIVESRDGRPIKIEGNPDHPSNRGTTDGMTQAAILELYDPDRSRRVLKRGRQVDATDDAAMEAFNKFFDDMTAKARAERGRGLAILSGRCFSPSEMALRGHVAQALPEAKWIAWESASDDDDALARQWALGVDATVRHDFEKADVVVALDADFLASGPDRLMNARRFARRRRRESGQAAPNRLYVAEGAFSLTGAMADHRLRLAPSQAPALALALVAEMAKQGLLSSDGPLGAVPSLASAKTPAGSEAWIRRVVEDAKTSPGRAILLGGPSLPAPMQALLHAVNAIRGADCVEIYESLGKAGQTPAPGLSAPLSMRSLPSPADIKTMLVLGGNPAYDAPGDVKFAEFMAKIPTTIHLSLYANETSALASWHCPRAHFLESWGDLRAGDGTVGMVQPLIEPLFKGKTDAELLARLGGMPDRRGYAIVRGYYQGRQAPDAFDPAWRAMLRSGIVPGTTQAPKRVAPSVEKWVKTVGRAKDVIFPDPPSAKFMEIVFLPDPNLYDGRFANNGWLQETPDPVSKVTWDNCAYMSLTTAKRLGAQAEDMVRIGTESGSSIEIPAWIVPGMADWVVALHLGYGRRRAGRVGNGVGVDVGLLRATSSPWGSLRAKIAKTGRKCPIACVQNHWAMEGRDLAREIVAGVETGAQAHGEAKAKGAPESKDASEPKKDESLWREHDYGKRPQWGMTIDLASCIGCNACMVACQAENNVPIVGKRHVREGREMHWIRVDRYFTVDEDEARKAGERISPDDMAKAALSDPGFAVDQARMVFQPMPCQHCENAPCEQVCPVGATTHGPEGLNEMAYNRCIGTRYCSNNCPFKVRRFNFFNYHEPADLFERLGGHGANNPLYEGLDKRDEDLLHMAANPDVTVRSRGVMEKCSFCVQRINRARHASKIGDRGPIPDGQVLTACQQACPTQAIAFGDIRDPASRVAAKKKAEGNYALLDDLNVKPRVSYLPRLRNPMPNPGSREAT